jgi:hypothetical protein
MLSRRNFLEGFCPLISLGGLTSSPFFARNEVVERSGEKLFLQEQVKGLFLQWAAGLKSRQLNESEGGVHAGVIRCDESPEVHHGRCGDSIYAFLKAAQLTGEEGYVRAAERLFDWMEKHVSGEEGCWYVEADNTKAWRGTSVFTAIMLYESLHYHGERLAPQYAQRMRDRLYRGGKFIFEYFHIGLSNINYPMTASYALCLLGQYFDEKKWIEKGVLLACSAEQFISKKDYLFFGEGVPRDGRSPKGLLPYDLGYNLEETLPSLYAHAQLMGNIALKEQIKRCVDAHLEWILPDGGIDNSIGTRSYKWSYWGSRTTDGCLGLFASLAKEDARYGRAFRRHLQLLEQFTHEGLLCGGRDLLSQGIKPCVHHTFSHSKVLAALLDQNIDWNELVNQDAVLPRESGYGVKVIEDTDCVLFSQDGWVATLAGYDGVSSKINVVHAMGGGVSMLYHSLYGPVIVASLAKYELQESYNMAKLDGAKDYCATPRLEFFEQEEWYTTLYDSKASLRLVGDNRCRSQAQCVATPKTSSQKPEREVLLMTETKVEKGRWQMRYQVKAEQGISENTVYKLPLIVQKTDVVECLSPTVLIVQKGSCQLKVHCTVPFELELSPDQRQFNHVPGFEFVTLIFKGIKDQSQWQVGIEVL